MIKRSGLKKASLIPHGLHRAAHLALIFCQANHQPKIWQSQNNPRYTWNDCHEHGFTTTINHEKPAGSGSHQTCQADFSLLLSNESRHHLLEDLKLSLHPTLGLLSFGSSQR